MDARHGSLVIQMDHGVRLRRKERNMKVTTLIILAGQSQALERQYPHLGGKISAKGLAGLEVCVLGSGSQYYARWSDGSWGSWPAEEVNNDIEKYSSLSDGSTIMDVAFGYGDSYVISYGHASNLKQLGNRWNLKGYYQDLYNFIEANNPMSILVSVLPRSLTHDPLLDVTLISAGYYARPTKYN